MNKRWDFQKYLCYYIPQSLFGTEEYHNHWWRWWALVKQGISITKFIHHPLVAHWHWSMLKNFLVLHSGYPDNMGYQIHKSSLPWHAETSDHQRPNKSAVSVMPATPLPQWRTAQAASHAARRATTVSSTIASGPSGMVRESYSYRSHTSSSYSHILPLYIQVL